MQQQKSFAKEGAEAALYLVPTPIGNLEDMSFRALRILKEADVIAAEDTRNTRKLCNYFEIETPVISYHEHNKETSGRQIIEQLQRGQVVALVSDAGMPTISDPGYRLVQDAIEENITVIPLPGANAALTALIASGIAPQPFYFYGFLQRSSKDKKKELEKLKKIESTWILYESPHRLKDTLKSMLDVLGDRNIVLCRELTKKFEEFIRGTLSESLKWAVENEIRGEFCLIIEGASEQEESSESLWWEGLAIHEHVQHYIDQKDLRTKDAIKQTAVDRDVPKRDIYQAYHVDE
ncbi:16S rRNA (cytidine(1402)-2'-O)-methyltransferase [Peribacillus psychrosaccharolyticus]|uniref:Ribosomal RNA small subunit methyltransferase I n=1 Tax=Peribacillus psychrosaccharolyticus TaxID=1407 RepID=A0A974RYX1_PERPY|nr:16S rRNA (cytidine(1402)-2'-O)-methyltransferase [Peribacillus psychrosaccharolyticus]MEC2058073.1 16S rRNA (cytidine(1402)-2'-O)-methyltransferase [Peribacillus psychrosaccharolyticus]MED3746068.1 16S rRNA (cytidine(1402)-2'-O)-methyltransferase [Peribacillus psychrosaccharolyticus]QQS98840.1 16S rRNA (cytidine(1402)-2'-O)-methyltransferase [Peribacillus psychrosaccharolyticus]